MQKGTGERKKGNFIYYQLCSSAMIPADVKMSYMNFMKF